MKFVVLLLFSPFVASTFTSLCPQQPNNVVVNCNNQNPFANPYFPGTIIPGTTIPVRGRVLHNGYNKPQRGSKFEFQFHRSDSSEELNTSSESDESDESSEEIVNHQIPFYPTHPVSHAHNPSIHTTTTLDNKLDFLRHGTGGVFRNNLRTFPRRNDIRGYVSSIRDNLSVDTGMPSVDETHGHGHSGQYNHNAHGSEHGHHGHNHEHGHEHGHGHGHGHEHNHGGNHHHHHVPSHIPTHITYPSNTVADGHIIPENIVPIGSILTGGTTDVFVNNQGNFNTDRGDPRIDSPTLQVAAVHPILGQYNQAEEVLMLTQRGFRAIGQPQRSISAYELENLIDRVIPMVSIPTVAQDGLNTEITCEPIPIDSAITQTAVLQGTGGQTTLNEDISTVNHSEMIPVQQSSSTLVTTENVDGHAQLPLSLTQPTVTKVTTTRVEELPMTTGMRIPMEESSGSTVTKVTTTKVEKRPTGETVDHGTSGIGSTVTKVTTTKAERHPIITNVVIPKKTIMYEMPLNTGSTGSMVTATTSEKLPMSTDEIVETPVQTSSISGSTITTVTTSKTEKRPINTDFTIPETIFHEAPVQTSSSSGSTITTVTTTNTKTDGKPINTDISLPETIVHEAPVQTSSSSGSTITTVTTTKTEGRPINTDITLPEMIIYETPVDTGISKVTTTTTEERPITTQFTEVIGDIGGETDTLVPIPEAGDVISDVVGDVGGLTRLVRPTRDGTHRYDRYRQRMAPLVYRV